MNSPNIVICGRREDPFARVHRSLLDDKRLSWKAKGIVAYLLSKPPAWKLRVADIVKHGEDGARAVRNGLNELRDLGYAEYIQPRNGGQFREGTWKISDSPIFSPRCAFAHSVNSHASKKECSKNKKPSPSSPKTGCINERELGSKIIGNFPRDPKE